MTTIKLIFFDIDDTLSRQGKIATHHVPLLKTLAAQGIKLAIATGRGRAMLPNDVMTLFDDGVFSAIICMNGQYNFTHKAETDDDHIISHYPLTITQAQTMVDICQRNDVIYKFDSSQIIGWGQPNKFAEMTVDNPKFAVAPDLHKTNEVYQCSVFFHADDDKKDLNTDFDAQGLKLVHWHNSGGDMMPIEASKARGIRDVCTHFAIDIAETMAFGDGMNDMEMFGLVGTSVAMGDGKAELKAVADYVTGSIEEHGIQTALQHVGVIA